MYKGGYAPYAHTAGKRKASGERSRGGSRVQGSLLPGSRQPDAAAAATAVEPIVDEQTLGIEVADMDTATVRAEIRTADEDVLEQTFTTG